LRIIIYWRQILFLLIHLIFIQYCGSEIIFFDPNPPLTLTLDPVPGLDPGQALKKLLDFSLFVFKAQDRLDFVKIQTPCNYLNL
jgi:hypothetical protein